MSSILGGVIGAAGSLFGASTAADAQKASAKAQLQATQESLALQREIYGKNVGFETPWMNAGTNALSSYGDALGINGADKQSAWYNNFQTDPGYANALKAGTDAVSSSAAARGTLYGGNTLKAINDYGGGMLQNAYNTRLNNLGTVMGYGAGATNALAGVGTNYANAAGQLATNPNSNGTNALANAGYYQGSGIIGAGNVVLGAMGYGNNNNSNNNSNNNNNNAYSSNSWKNWLQ